MPPILACHTGDVNGFMRWSTNEMIIRGACRCTSSNGMRTGRYQLVTLKLVLLQTFTFG
jgi:hypothetical protein